MTHRPCPAKNTSKSSTTVNMALTKPVHKPRKKSSTSHKPQTLLTFLAQACVNPPHTLAQNPKPHVGVSENSTLKNRILIIQTPKKVPLIFGNFMSTRPLNWNGAGLPGAGGSSPGFGGLRNSQRPRPRESRSPNLGPYTTKGRNWDCRVFRQVAGEEGFGFSA